MGSPVKSAVRLESLTYLLVNLPAISGFAKIHERMPMRGVIGMAGARPKQSDCSTREGNCHGT